MLLTSIISILHLLNISLCRFFRQGARNCLARLCALTAAPSCLEKTARKHENQIFQDVASDVPEEKVEAPPMPRFLARFNPLPRRNPLPRHIRRSSFGYFYPVESIYYIYIHIVLVRIESCLASTSVASNRCAPVCYLRVSEISEMI